MTVYTIKRIWKLLASLLFIIILICFLQNPLTYNQVVEQPTAVSEQIIIDPNKAFVTFLCDDIMVLFFNIFFFLLPFSLFVNICVGRSNSSVDTLFKKDKYKT